MARPDTNSGLHFDGALHLSVLWHSGAQTHPLTFVHVSAAAPQSSQTAETLNALQSNPGVLEYMKRAGLKDMAALEAAFEERVLSLASAAGRSYIIWQDVVDNGVKVC